MTVRYPRVATILKPAFENAETVPMKRFLVLFGCDVSMGYASRAAAS